MSTTGTRGKAAEKAVEKVLTGYNEKLLAFAWHRLPDARAARGRLKAQPADYYLAVAGRAYHLEIKETSHSSRLAKDKLAQIPLLRKFNLAGMPFAVLVYHTELKRWRSIPGTFFDGDIPPSWDLSSFPLLDSAEAAFQATGWLTQSN